MATTPKKTARKPRKRVLKPAAETVAKKVTLVPGRVRKEIAETKQKLQVSGIGKTIDEMLAPAQAEMLAKRPARSRFQGGEWDATFEHLSQGERVFVEEYLVSFTPAEAFSQSFGLGLTMTAKELHQHGVETMKNPLVKNAIRDGMALMGQKYEGIQNRIVEELSSLSFSNMADYFDIDSESGEVKLDLAKASYEQMAAVSELVVTVTEIGSPGDERYRRTVNTKLKLHDKFKALTLLTSRFNIAPPVASRDEGDGFEIVGGLPESFSLEAPEGGGFTAAPEPVDISGSDA